MNHGEKNIFFRQIVKLLAFCRKHKIEKMPPLISGNLVQCWLSLHYFSHFVPESKQAAFFSSAKRFVHKHPERPHQKLKCFTFSSIIWLFLSDNDVFDGFGILELENHICHTFFFAESTIIEIWNKYLLSPALSTTKYSFWNWRK